MLIRGGDRLPIVGCQASVMQKTLTFAFTDNWQLTTYSPPISNQHSAISIHVESVMRIDRAISGSRLWIMTLAGALMFCAPLPGQDQPPATQLGELTRGGPFEDKEPI